MKSSEHELLLPPVEEENICLPLSVNAVSKYWNIDLPLPEAIEIAKKYSNVNGSILIEGIELAERHGLGSLILHSSISELKIGDKKSEKSNRLCFVSERLNIQRKPDEAVQSLKNAIDLDNKNSTAFALLGGILNEQGSPECVKYYEKSIAINDRCYLAYRGLGNYYLKNKQHDNAEQYYTKAIQINPTRFGPIYKNRGLARLEQKKTREARQDFENYLKHTPNAKDKQSILQAISEL